MTQASYQWVDSDSGDAAFGWVDATVEEVVAEQEQRRKQAERRQPKGPTKKGRPAPAELSPAAPRRSELDRLAQILERGKRARGEGEG